MVGWRRVRVVEGEVAVECAGEDGAVLELVTRIRRALELISLTVLAQFQEAP